MDDFKRNQIPAFGNWDYSDGFPITQYFESARQAGLIRYSCGEQDLYGGGSYDLYTTTVADDDFLRKPASITVVSRRKAKGAEKRYTHHGYNKKELKKQGRVYDWTEPAPAPPPSRQKQHRKSSVVPPSNPKAVDEDLYKIPPELLYTKTKRKKMLGFFSRCLMPSCAV